jgi:nucleoporin POM152
VYTLDHRARNEILKSAQETGILHLGDEPGSHSYALRELSDANYRKIPINIGIEHTVHARPSASFSKLNTGSLCLDSALSGNARVQLTGKAPFTLELSVRKPASSRIDTFTVDISAHEWTLDLPYAVKDVGRYEVTITGVKDSSGCDWQLGERDTLSTLVEVVESARIVPVSQEKDLCAGDTLDFLLQGKAPWTIE